MNASDIFLSSMAILLIFNFIYVTTAPTITWNLTIGAITGFIVLVLAVGIVSGVQFLGSGFNGESVKIMFGCGALMNILFQIDIMGFPIGIGLATNVLNCFGSEWLGLGVITTSILSLMAFVSGLIIITGGYAS